MRLTILAGLIVGVSLAFQSAHAVHASVIVVHGIERCSGSTQARHGTPRWTSDIVVKMGDPLWTVDLRWKRS